jgi:hypothetical protein
MSSASGRRVTQPASQPSGKSPLERVAWALAAVGIASVVGLLFVDSWIGVALYYGGFVALALAAAAAVAGWIPGRGRRFTFLPHTPLGWAGLGVLLGGLALSIVPSYIEVTSRGASQLQNTAIQLGFVTMAASAIVTLAAVFRSGERCLPLIALSLLAGLVVPFMVLALVVMGAAA